MNSRSNRFAVMTAVCGWFVTAIVSSPVAFGQDAAPSPVGGVWFPADAGVFNVRDAEFGAQGDGVTDDTAAIQKALSKGLDTHRIIYLPDGTYLVSDTLKWWREGYNLKQVNGWGAFLQLQGQSEAGTILKLKDTADGFSDAAKPKAVIATGSRGYHGSKGYKSGEGNEAFENNIRNLTVDTGRGNAGAVGIDYQISNFGAMRHVTIRSGDGAGAVGLSMARRDNGPALVDHVMIDGFDTGIKVAGTVCQLTYEHITLRGQKKIGLDVENAVVAIRRLTSQNTVTAARVSGMGLLNVLDSTLTGGEAGQTAIINAGDDAALVLAGVTTGGYGEAVDNRGTKVPADRIAGVWSADGTQSAFKDMTPPDRIAVLDSPEMPLFAATDWASTGAPDGKTDADLIEKAMACGKPVLYFPYGSKFKPNRTIIVPPTVKAIVGFGTGIDFVQAKPDTEAALFRIEGGEQGDVLWIDRMTGGTKGAFIVDHASPRTLVLKDTQFWGAQTYRNREGSGPAFADGVGGSWRIDFSTDVYARNFDIEGKGVPKVVLATGSRLWALGYKTESANTMLDAKPGSRAEMWGGLAYTFGSKEDSPAFVIDEAAVMLSFAGITFKPDGYYKTLVRETRGGETKTMRKADGFKRGAGATVPLYIATPTK